MIATSHIFSQMVNKVGGIVYFKSRFAAIAGRAKVKPVDSNTNYQETIRALFSSAVAGYKTLLVGDRDGWDGFAMATPWKNALGDTVYLTGQEMYIAHRCSYISAFPAEPPANFDTCPCTPGLAPQPLLTFACCANPTIGVIVTVNNTSDSELMDFVVEISPPQSPSKKFYKGRFLAYAKLTATDVAAGSSDDLEFCGICEARYFFRVRGWESADPHRLATETFGWADACTDAP